MENKEFHKFLRERGTATEEGIAIPKEMWDLFFRIGELKAREDLAKATERTSVMQQDIAHGIYRTGSLLIVYDFLMTFFNVGG